MRWHFRHIPLVDNFVNLWVPFTITFVGTITSYFAVEGVLPTGHVLLKSAITLILATVIFDVTLRMQEYFHKYVFTKGLSSFVSSIKLHHPVTQKFASELLLDYLNAPKFAETYKGLFSGNSISNLTELMKSVESVGVRMDTASYEKLLRKAAELAPTTLSATWDLSANEIGYKKYLDWFSILDTVYKGMKNEEKSRIFILDPLTMTDLDSDAKKFLEDVLGSTDERDIWTRVLDKHFLDWGFPNVYFCDMQTFNTVRRGFGNAEQRLSDFALFEKRSCVLFKWAWVIGQANSTTGNQKKPTYLVRDERATEGTREFLNQLKKESLHLTKSDYMSFTNATANT